MNWMDSYINRVTTGPIDLMKVKDLSENLVEKLNKKGEGKLSNKIEFDKNYDIIFPDCKIKFYNEHNDLIFDKFDRKTEEKLDTLKLVDVGEKIYIFRDLSKVDEVQNLEYAVEFAFEFLLTQSLKLLL